MNIGVRRARIIADEETPSESASSLNHDILVLLGEQRSTALALAEKLGVERPRVYSRLVALSNLRLIIAHADLAAGSEQFELSATGKGALDQKILAIG